MPTDSEGEYELVSKEWLLAKLRSDERDMILIDCRGSNEYSVCHIRSAVNFSIPSIMLRRLSAGKIELASTVQCKELKARIAHCRARGCFVLYGDGARDCDSVHAVLLKRLKQDAVHVVTLEDDFSEFHRAYPEWCSESGAQHVPHLPLMGLRNHQERVRLRGLRDASNPFALAEKKFRKLFRVPNSSAQYLCEVLDHPRFNECDNIPKHLKILGALHFYTDGGYQTADGGDSLIALSQPSMCRGLEETTQAIVDILAPQYIKFPSTPEEKQKTMRESLRISGSGCDDALSSGSSSECEDTHTHAQPEFPIEILPNLYLGNSTNSEDCDALAKHNIKYVLNVTPDLPNTFEAQGCGINYLKIPIADHWSQNLAVHFPQAIRFIEEAMSAQCGVLVHCVAGVSRSVTVTLAYLMQRHRLCLRDAFELVRARKADIAPNFHFMRQLHSFERDLGLHERCAPLSKVLEELGVGELQAPDSGVAGGAGGGARGAGVRPAARDCGCAAPAGVSPDSGIEFDRWSAARDTPQ